MKAKRRTLKEFEAKLNNHRLIEKSISGKLKGGNSGDDDIFKNSKKAETGGG